MGSREDGLVGRVEGGSACDIPGRKQCEFLAGVVHNLWRGLYNVVGVHLLTNRTLRGPSTFLGGKLEIWGLSKIFFFDILLT